MPAYKYGTFSGKINLFKNGILGIGFLNELMEFAEVNKIPLEVNLDKNNISNDFFDKFIKKLELPFKPHDYQMKYFKHVINEKHAICVSATASGKSLIAYLVIRFLLMMKKQIILVVPNVSLVEQMYKDFEEYGFKDIDKYVQRIHGGHKSKTLDKQLVISTWQSIYKNPISYFDKVDAFIGDEVHSAKSLQVSTMLTKMNNLNYSMGLTGTLPAPKNQKYVGYKGPIGQIGQPVKFITTQELQERGQLSKINVNVINLIYKNKKFRETIANCTFAEEVDLIYYHKERNKLLLKKYIDKKNNTLVFFTRIEHGKELFEIARNLYPNKKILYVDGEVNVKRREEIRVIMEANNDCIGVVSYNTFGTGINIKNIHRIISTANYKSEIKVLQAIGRGLRKHKSKDELVIYDIVDNCKFNNKSNFLLKHFKNRKEYYERESWDYKITNIEIEK